MKIELEEKVSGFTERDMNSKALLNTDVNGLLAYKMKTRNSMVQESQTKEINMLKEKVNNIQEDVSEIRQMLKQLIQATQ